MIELAINAMKIAAAAYIGVCLLVFLRQSSYVYYPDRTLDATPAYAGIQFEDLMLHTADGETINAWYVPAKLSNRLDLTVIDCHGNAGDIGDRVNTVAMFHNLGFDVLIFDYRGYGKSSGKPTEKGTYLDARAAWDYLTKIRKITPDRIVIFGRSLGGSIAAWLATQVRPRALVIESGFTSAPDMGRIMFPYLPVRLLCRIKYDTFTYIRSVKCPVIVAHSTEDEMIPFEHGRKLYNAAPEPKLFFELKGDHNAGGIDITPSFQQKLVSFVLSNGPHSETDKQPSK